MEFLTGKDYPWVCEYCQATITQMAQMFAEGEMEDTDDPEAACMFMYDNWMYCGGQTCKREGKALDGK